MQRASHAPDRFSTAMFSASIEALLGVVHVMLQYCGRVPASTPYLRLGHVQDLQVFGLDENGSRSGTIGTNAGIASRNTAKRPFLMQSAALIYQTRVG
jgi:hypothetical protein